MGCTLRGTIRYDGTDFAGWQRQPQRRTVQGALEAALSAIASQSIAVQGAGRTDAGVHALAQVFSCAWPGEFPPRLRHALSKMLGPEIRVTALTEAPEGFNARFHARAKRYAYSLDFSKEPDPLTARYAWHVPFRVDFDLLRDLAPLLLGTHDFGGFQSSGHQMKNTVRTLFDVQLLPGGVLCACDSAALWRIEYHGDGFLYKMVRNLTGTLIEVARGRFPPEKLNELLDSRGPFLGHCAPPHGLTLLEVLY